MCEDRRTGDKPARPDGTREQEEKNRFLLDLLQGDDAGLPEQCCIPVQYERQVHDWDCGLACAAMVLSVLVRPAPSLQALSELCRTTSVWTIDLAHVLRHYGIQVIVTTTCLGANPSYSSASFYAPHLEHDIARVNELFARADGAGINVIKASISSAQLKRLLRTCKYLAIALVDKTKTGHALQIGSPSGVVRLDSGMVDDTYTGHFILLHGYDSLADEYFFKDPAAPVGSNGRMSPALLDEARQSYGTDEDLIFICIPNP